MEKSRSYLYQSSIRELNDISNLKPITNNPDGVKQSLKNSYVEEFKIEQKSARSSSSGEQNCIKGIRRYARDSKITELKLDLPFQHVQNQATALKQYSAAKSPRNILSFSDQTYQVFGESTSIKSNKPIERTYNRSMKVSSVGYASHSPYFGQIPQKQNKPTNPSRRFNDQKSLDKDKIYFRDSLGSLSKLIKNTLKLSLNNDDSEALAFKEEENILNKKMNTHQRSKAGSIVGEGEEGFKRYEKTSSFFVNGSLNRLKRSNNLDLKLNIDLATEKKETSQRQNTSYGQTHKTPKKYSRAKIQTDRIFLGKSTVTSTNLKNDNPLKYSSVVEPLTPQMRGGKKYDSYNYEKKQKQKTPFINCFTSQKPDLAASFSHTKTSSNLSNFGTTKSSLLHSSSVTQNSNKFCKDRDSLSSKERSSLGKQLSLNDFQMGSIKGQGRFGKFYPAIHKKTGMLVGIKQIKKQSLKYMLDQFIQELKIQTFIDHPNIVKLYGYFSTKQNFYLVLEYMEEGSLFSFIKKSRKLQEQQTSTKLKQICSAVQYLHENEILHRDIKPENIVMTCDVCKLCDFGWAVYSSTRRKTYCGTLDYVCPEILQGDSYDACVDIWAIGVLAYEMIVGKAPFYNISRKETMKKIMDCDFEIPKDLSSKAKDFISKALNKNPQYRQSVQALGKHEFLN